MKDIENSFAGNMCRCTGYRSIADAFKTFATDVDERLRTKLVDLEDLGIIKPCGVKCKEKCPHKSEKESVKCNIGTKDDREEWCVIEKANSKMIVIDSGTHKWFKAYSLEDVFKAMSRSDEYKLIAGNTGQGNIVNIMDIHGKYESCA